MWNTRREKFVKIRNIARKYHNSNCCCCVNKISWLGVWKMERNLLFVNYIFQGIIIISCWLKNSIRALHFFRQFRRNDSNTCFFFFMKKNRLNSKDKFEDSYHWNCTIHQNPREEWHEFQRMNTCDQSLCTQSLQNSTRNDSNSKNTYIYIRISPTFNLHWTDSQNFHSNFFFSQNFKGNKLNVRRNIARKNFLDIFQK